MSQSFQLPTPVRPGYVWVGYFLAAVLLSNITDAAWVSQLLGIALLLAVFETIRFFMHRRRHPVGTNVAGAIVTSRPDYEDDAGSSSQDEARETYRSWNEDREVKESQREFESLWKGQKRVEFEYRNMGRGSWFTVDATVTEVISPEFGDDEETYFKGAVSSEQPRYFCLRYVKGKKVKDPASGATGTLRKVLGVKRRVYK